MKKKLEYWMFAELIKLAQDAYKKEVTKVIGKHITLDTKEKQEAWMDTNQDKFNPVGKLNLIMSRLEIMRDAASEEAEKVLEK